MMIAVQWEYRVLALGGLAVVAQEERLNAAGREGWELVGVLRQPLELGRALSIAYLKRAQEGEEEP